MFLSECPKGAINSVTHSVLLFLCDILWPFNFFHKINADYTHLDEGIYTYNDQSVSVLIRKWRSVNLFGFVKYFP